MTRGMRRGTWRATGTTTCAVRRRSTAAVRATGRGRVSPAGPSAERTRPSRLRCRARTVLRDSELWAYTRRALLTANTACCSALGGQRPPACQMRSSTAQRCARPPHSWQRTQVLGCVATAAPRVRSSRCHRADLTYGSIMLGRRAGGKGERAIQRAGSLVGTSRCCAPHAHVSVLRQALTLARKRQRRAGRATICRPGAARSR